MKKKEIIFFSILFIIAAAVLIISRQANSQTQLAVLITVDGEEYMKIDLDDATDESFTIETEYGTNDVVIFGGEVNVVDADCPTQVCVNTKAASKAGDIIVCLPHKLIIEIVER